VLRCKPVVHADNGEITLLGDLSIRDVVHGRYSDDESATVNMQVDAIDSVRNEDPHRDAGNGPGLYGQRRRCRCQHVGEELAGGFETVGRLHVDDARHQLGYGCVRLPQLVEVARKFLFTLFDCGNNEAHRYES